MKIVKPKFHNPGDKKSIEFEEYIKDISFDIYKFNNRVKPADKSKVLLISCFFEFGCEIVGIMYVIPHILRNYPGAYVIAVGWHGREYLYRHLVDEFWEIKEEYQWLREYCRAFHHESKNLRLVEKNLNKYGKVIASNEVGNLTVRNDCLECNHLWGQIKDISTCPECGSKKISHSLFSNVSKYKSKAIRIPLPNEQKIKEANQYLKENAVGIFARGRVCYGRNLQPEFYVNLINLLEEMGYNPIWLGEKQSTQPCPVDHIVDFSRMPEARDLELTLAIISQLKFTIQFWTASTRLASIVDTPYILFESPDQIWGNGQEGYRRNLCDFGKNKLAICHFLNVYNDNKAGLDLVKRCVQDVENECWDDVIELVQDPGRVKEMADNNYNRIGGRGNN